MTNKNNNNRDKTLSRVSLYLQLRSILIRQNSAIRHATLFYKRAACIIALGNGTYDTLTQQTNSRTLASEAILAAFIDVPALFITRGESHSFSMDCGGKCNYDAANCITNL